MPEAKQDRATRFGSFGGRDDPPRFGSTEVFAAALTVIWVIAIGTFFVMTGGAVSNSGALTAVMTLLAVFLPVAMIWVAVLSARSLREMREEAARLQATVEAMRSAYIQQSQAAASGVKPEVERKIDELAAAQRQTETALATFSSRRDATQTVPSADRRAALAVPEESAGDEQPTLALGTPAEALRPPLAAADFITALNFPESPDDKEGFRALRAALDDRDIARLIRAAQDVLTLLSQDGIYMDDLKPDRARPEIWRRFAQGERGRAIAGLGGVRDRSSLALTAGRMRTDPVFRDAAHHFLRQFDKTFASFEATASDQEIAALAETRTARAFMLFGRVTGTFD
ncbi:hypothetical protein [Acidimangrovimonas pyrenivorans]|uniref:Uncharacterized protein n=1 Tax=Acidimangrovimonas pyrenivorans TaxID=2030798 RepID=A0ABV7AJ41_9RHOB